VRIAARGADNDLITTTDIVSLSQVICRIDHRADFQCPACSSDPSHDHFVTWTTGATGFATSRIEKPSKTALSSHQHHWIQRVMNNSSLSEQELMKSKSPLRQGIKRSFGRPT